MRILVEKLIEIDSSGNLLQYQEISGLSTESKPTTGLVTGSMFMEVDSGNVYLFDEDAAAGSEWVLEFCLQEPSE